MLKRPAFEDAMVRLVAGFLALSLAEAPPPQPGRTRMSAKPRVGPVRSKECTLHFRQPANRRSSVCSTSSW